MIWEKLLGQAAAVDILRRSAASGRLAHALLFVGPRGVGKGLAARNLAMTLLCERFPESELEACGDCRSCRMMLAGTHPDFLNVECPEGKSELPIELLVGSRENRGSEGLCHDLSLRPMAGGRRIAVIDDADRMSNESANALLKTLEEPPSYAVIILIAADASRILPTIRSRCQTVHFSPLETPHIARLVTELEWAEDASAAETAAAMSGGSLALAQQLLNPELRALRTALVDGLNQPALQPYSLAQTVLSALDAVGGDTQRQRTNAQWVIRFLIDYFQNALRQWCANPAEPEAAESLGQAIDRCVEAEGQLAGNVAIPLCLETLFSDLATTLRERTESRA